MPRRAVPTLLKTKPAVATEPRAGFKSQYAPTTHTFVSYFSHRCNNNSGGRNLGGEGFILGRKSIMAGKTDMAFPHILPSQETETALAAGSGFYPQEPDSSNLPLPKCAITSKTGPPSENQVFSYVSLWGSIHTTTHSHPQIAYTPKEFQDIGGAYTWKRCEWSLRMLYRGGGHIIRGCRCTSMGMVLTRKSFSQFFSP